MGTTNDRNDPRLTHGIDTEPTEQADMYLVDDGQGEYVRPVRRSYQHECGTVTTMSQDIAETYARNPKFYGATYCCGCRVHAPVGEFVWVDHLGRITTEAVGS